VIVAWRAMLQQPEVPKQLEQHCNRLESWREKRNPGSNAAIRKVLAQMQQATQGTQGAGRGWLELRLEARSIFGEKAGECGSLLGKDRQALHHRANFLLTEFVGVICLSAKVTIMKGESGMAKSAVQHSKVVGASEMA